MNCESVCIGGEFDYDIIGTNIVTRPKANRPHKCCECKRAIESGSHYERQVAISDGTAQTFKTCLLCVEIRDAYCCHGYEFGELLFNLRSELLPWMTTKCLDKLTTAAAKVWLRDYWQQWQLDEMPEARGK